MVEIQIGGPERLHDADPDVQTMHSNSDEAGKPGGRAGNRIKRRIETRQIVVSQGAEPQDLGAVKKVENS